VPLLDADDAPLVPSARPLLQLGAPPIGTLGVAADLTAGQGVALDSRGKVPTGAGATLIATADPAEPYEGQSWVRSDLNEWRWREGGVTYKVVGTAV
jgi:hypothetical protein